MDYVDLDNLRQQAPNMSQKFQNAKPYPYIKIDDFLNDQTRQELVQAFPAQDSACWDNVDHEHQRFKLSCSSVERMPIALRNAIFELNSGPFIEWLEQLSGIKHLQPDPFLVGGGLHATLPGGYLTPHVDFHTIGDRPLFRRLNLLVYLNENWSEQNNGNLEIWDKQADQVVDECAPTIGNALIFRTDMESMHGFSKPVKNQMRCSIALYYYTVEKPEHFSGDAATHWRVKSVKSGSLTDGLRLTAQQGFAFVGRTANAIGWRAYSVADKLRK